MEQNSDAVENDSHSYSSNSIRKEDGVSSGSKASPIIYAAIIFVLWLLAFFVPFNVDSLGSLLMPFLLFAFLAPSIVAAILLQNWTFRSKSKGDGTPVPVAIRVIRIAIFLLITLSLPILVLQLHFMRS